MEVRMLQRLSAFLTLVALALLAPFPAVAQQAQPAPPPAQWYWGPGPWHMWGGWGDGYGSPFWWIFPVVMMLFMFVACAAIFYFLFARGPHHHLGHMMGGHRDYGDPSQSALQILNERFARGEIQRDEYEEKKAIILAGR
jgi:putative membrane protein